MRSRQVRTGHLGHLLNHCSLVWHCRASSPLSVLVTLQIPTALWVEIKKIQLTVPTPAEAVATTPVLPSRFAPGETIVDEAVGTPLCTVKQSVGRGAFGEVYQVVWTGIGADRGATLAMKTTRLADISSDERDEYRVLLMEEILTVCQKRQLSVKDLNMNAIACDCVLARMCIGDICFAAALEPT